MIAATFEPIPIGQKITGRLSDSKGIYHIIPFIALREATREEYIAFVKENAETELTFTQDEWKILKYYEVSMD